MYSEIVYYLQLRATFCFPDNSPTIFGALCHVRTISFQVQTMVAIRRNFTLPFTLPQPDF